MRKHSVCLSRDYAAPKENGITLTMSKYRAHHSCDGQEDDTVAKAQSSCDRQEDDTVAEAQSLDQR
eukprot:m.210098 g.210098  ORF g.210098 m.210098 type:complete len:66 (-) comp18999_c0_seq2:26-223(-)